MTESIRSASVPEFTVYLFFRGGWCPFCQSWLRTLDGRFREQIEAAGGRLVGVTSQSAAAAKAAHDTWRLGFDVVSAPDNTLARTHGVAITPKAATPLAADPVEYPDGMAQPAVVVLNARGERIYRWAIDPSQMNLGGASDRPLPEELWASIAAARRGEPVAPFTGERLDPAYLAAHFPAQHETFLAWVAAASAAERA